VSGARLMMAPSGDGCFRKTRGPKMNRQRTRKRFSLLWLLLPSSVLLAACGGSDGEEIPTSIDGRDPGSSGATPPPASTPPPSIPSSSAIDLRADTNRDGVVRFDDPADDDGEEIWDAKHGAVFLANIDDDEEKCPTDEDDVDLPKCNDAADDVVNGDADARDLARLKTKPWAAAPDGATGSIVVSVPSIVRMFKVKGKAFEVLAEGDKLTTEELRVGVELAIEARDIVRDPAKWDGFVDVTFAVSAGSATESDKVRMRVAPLLTSHHLSAAESTYVSLVNSTAGQASRADLATAATAAGVAAPKGISTTDQWTQDFFETGFMSMPGPNGTQHAMRVNIRSANESNPQSVSNPLRRAGRVVFTQMRGKDSAGLQQFDPKRYGRFDTLNSFGNFETIPPFTMGTDSFPLGRVLRGNIASYYPDKTFLLMIEAQKVQQPLYIDTSWLLVGHVDETLSFIKAPSARGWVMLVNDPTLAKTMLQTQSDAGNGEVPMFVGKSWSATRSAQVTINQVLSDTEVMEASAQAAVEIDSQVAIIKAATGLLDSEIIHIPYLHMAYSQGLIAYQPGMVNGLYMAPGHFVAPDPHGPDIAGRDIFKDAMEERLAPFGVAVQWAEDWDLYHRAMGEIHCGTNATRKIPDTKWWESGR
jgi:protein-arginine deiminase